LRGFINAEFAAFGMELCRLLKQSSQAKQLFNNRDKYTTRERFAIGTCGMLPKWVLCFLIKIFK
jgi:hypothetical protein